jgi:hypothetical protein
VLSKFPDHFLWSFTPFRNYVTIMNYNVTNYYEFRI